MDTPRILLTLLVIVAVGVVVLFLILRLFRRQAARLREEMSRSGETVLVGPATGFYQGVAAGFVSVKTYGVVVLTDRQIVFRKPLGGDIRVALSEITQATENTWFAGNYRGGSKFLILTLAGGTTMAFMVKDQDRWVREITARIGQT